MNNQTRIEIVSEYSFFVEMPSTKKEALVMKNNQNKEVVVVARCCDLTTFRSDANKLAINYLS